MNYLCIDVGTTCCKCQLFSQGGDILEYFVEEYDFLRLDGRNYIDVEAIRSCLFTMIEKIAKRHEISSFCVSSLGESFVLLDENDEVLFPPMIYTDERGEEEAREIIAVLGEEKAFRISGVIPHAMYSVSKLLWIKKHHKDVYQKAKKLMLVGEYIGYLLSGQRIIDYSLASRTGMFDIEALEFSKEFTDAFNLSPDLFSKPMRAGTVVGKIRPELVEQLGIKGDPILVLGSHDQICTALGAGVLKEGEAVDGMGTVECITTLFSKKPDDVEMGKMGYPCVPFAVEGLYCTYILNFSCGSTVNWLKKKIMHNYGGNDGNFYKYIESQVPDAPGNLLLLPYLGGAGTPYQDGAARGAILGLSTDTSDGEIYRAIMEGTSMEMRLNEDTVKKYAVNLSSLVATGGCANSEKWMQIKSDIQGHPIKILRSGEGGLCGCAMLSAVATGGAENLEAAKDIFVRYAKEFTPNVDERIKYESNYSKYKKFIKL